MPRGLVVRVGRAAGAEALRPTSVQSERLHGRAEIVLSRCARGAQSGRRVLPVQVSTIVCVVDIMYLSMYYGRLCVLYNYASEHYNCIL